jgi:hypothetical protein
MTERRAKTSRRSHHRAPGKFNATLDATHAILRQMEKEGRLPQPISMKGTLYKFKGLLEISNLDHQLAYAGYEMGDEVGVKVEFVNRKSAGKKSEPVKTVKQLMQEGKIVDAIRLHREKTDCSLREAIAHVETLKP